MARELSPQDWYDQLVAQGYTEEHAARRAFPPAPEPEPEPEPEVEIPSLNLARQSWRERALCAQVDAEMFFPEGQGASGRNPKQVCARCEVCEECLQDALDRLEQHGVWGGKSPLERLQMRNQAKGEEKE